MKLRRYDPKTKETTVVADGLHGANGIALSEAEDFLVVSEILKGRLLKVHLKGPRAGQKELFSRMPGLPDNITPSGNKGGFLVGVPMPLLQGKEDLMYDGVLQKPWLCKLISRVALIFKRAFTFARSVAPFESDLLRWLEFRATTPPPDKKGPAGKIHTFLLELDAEGKILRSWQGHELSPVSEGFRYGDTVYVGSYLGKWVAALPY